MTTPRNLVIIFDATDSNVDHNRSNALKMYNVAQEDETQARFYRAGIGARVKPDGYFKGAIEARHLFALATGYGFYDDVIAAYDWLARRYRPGDNIFIMGASRGGEEAKALAGCIGVVGLLNPDQHALAGKAFDIYKKVSMQDKYRTANEYRELMNTQDVPIRFLGVWDAVNSTLAPDRPVHLEHLPWTGRNPKVQTARHAIAIREKRAAFQVSHFERPVQNGVTVPATAIAEHAWTDVREVYFPGTHGDVIGGYPEEEAGLSKYPLLWMIQEAQLCGLHVDTERVRYMMHGHETPNGLKLYPADTAAPDHESLNLAWKVAGVVTSLAGYTGPRVIPPGETIHLAERLHTEKVPSYHVSANLPATVKWEGFSPKTIADSAPPGL